EMPAAAPLIITEPVNIDDERRRRIGADEELQLVAGAHALLAGVAFDPWTAIARLRIDACVGELPVGGAFALILAANEVALRASPLPRRGFAARQARDHSRARKTTEELPPVQSTHGHSSKTPLSPCGRGRGLGGEGVPVGQDSVPVAAPDRNGILSYVFRAAG